MPPGGQENSAVAVQVATRGPEVQRAGPSPAEMAKIRTAQQARFAEGKRGMGELGGKGINLGENNGRTPQQIIESIPGWQNDAATQEYVGGAQQLYRELEDAKDAIRAPLRKSGKPIDETAIAAEAEQRVLEARIKAATPEPEAPPTTAETEGKPEEVKPDPELEADAAALHAWVEGGALGEEARPVLEFIAAGQAVKTAEARLRDLNKADQEAKTENQHKFIEAQRERAINVLKKAREDFERMMKSNDRLKTDTGAPDEVRLLAYDIDARQTAIELRDAETAVAAFEGIPRDQMSAAGQEQLDKTVAKRDALKAKQTALKNERKNIGTPEQRRINYIEAEVIRLTRDLPPKPPEPPKKDENGQDIVLSDEQIEEARKVEVQRMEAERKADPVAYLQSEIDRLGISVVLENSDLSPKDQKKLVELGTVKTAERAIINKELLEKGKNTGKTGIMAILLLLYTAHGANKKSKGQAMG